MLLFYSFRASKKLVNKMSDKAEVPNKTNTSDVSTLKDGGGTALKCVKKSNTDDNRDFSSSDFIGISFKSLVTLDDLSKRWYYGNVNPETGKKLVSRYFAR